MRLNREGRPIDPVTVKAMAAVSGEYLLELMDVTATAANAELYALETRKASMQRSIAALAEELAAKADDDPREMIDRAKAELERIESQDTAKELASPDEAMLEFYAHRDEVDSGQRGCVPTGLGVVDKILGGGMLNSGMYVVAARPGMGKTAMAIQVMDHVAQEGPVLFVSLEMDLEQIEARRISRVSGISSTALLMDRLTDQEQDRMAEAADKIRALPVSINRKPTATVADIEHMARKIKGLRCIVVDYLGKVSPGTKKQSRYEYMTEISGELKTMARTFRVPVMVLAQLNRENTNRAEKRPQLSDLRDTGAIEQDADGVIFLHRPDYYEDKTERAPWAPVELEVIVEKNRHGETGKCSAAFYMRTGKIIPAKTERRLEALDE